MLFNFPSTTACSVAFASALVVATPTLMLAKHPLVSTTVVSVGSLVEPQVATSGAVDDEAVLIRERTNLKSVGEEQVVELTAG